MPLKRPVFLRRKGKDMYIGDLHIHSRYSRATSKDCTPEFLELWARKKGIDLIGTGDFTHPAWREELREKLEPAEEGLYVLKEEYRIPDGAPGGRPRFVVTGEISSIYKKADRVRKVHSLLLLPGLEEADRLARRLELIGNIHSDGRPILGLDCRDLLEIMLDTCPEAVYVPAHIWTPHFSLLGAFSGFDRIEDCFEDLTPYVRALETGLSSDPPMNRRVSALDSYQLISNSDAHSPAKLGREATLFDTRLSFPDMARAVNRGEGLAGTLEFFPEEGKYHFDGHRKCGLCLEPGEAEKYGNICPVCGKKLTIGVLHRVEELADREEGYRGGQTRPFESLVPLPEVIAACTGAGAAGKRVRETYEHMLGALGAEFAILRQVPEEDIRRAAGPLIAEGISRLRAGLVERTPGFDGEYGRILLLDADEISSLEGQLSLFTPEERKAYKKENAAKEAGKKAAAAPSAEGRAAESASEREQTDGEPVLNARQREAVCAADRAVAVIAGPGAGKTKTLLSHLLYLLKERGADPEEITAVTFTNQAAEELRGRLEKLPEGGQLVKKLRIGTFHALCGGLLTENGMSFYIADEGLQEELAQKAGKEFELKMTTKRFLREVSLRKSGLPSEGGKTENTFDAAFAYYQRCLRDSGALDYDDLLLEALALYETKEGTPLSQTRFSYLLADEFQDISPVQYRLLRAWNKEGAQLFVIGDPDQSIYGFRGSDARCFDRLEEDYPRLRRIRLTTNYRSTPEILSGALTVISHNEGPERVMEAAGKSGRPVRIVKASDERNEAIFVAKEINRLIGGIDMLDVQEEERRLGRGVRSFADIAVLYRTHRQARILEYCLRQEGIPYVVAGREDFLFEKPVRSALYFFQWALYPGDAGAAAAASGLLFPEGGEKAEAQLKLLTDKYRRRVRRAKPLKLLEEWAADVGKTEDEALGRLMDMAVLHRTMEALLQTLSFGEDGDIRRNGGRKFLSDAVTLMTFHGSKGLEFPAVFLYGVRKGLTPLERSGGRAALEEERRLFYVGMTRAKEELILTASGEDSPFLKELPERGVMREEAKKEKAEPEAAQLSLFDRIW